MGELCSTPGKLTWHTYYNTVWNDLVREFVFMFGPHFGRALKLPQEWAGHGGQELDQLTEI